MISCLVGYQTLTPLYSSEQDVCHLFLSDVEGSDCVFVREHGGSCFAGSKHPTSVSSHTAEKNMLTRLKYFTMFL